MRTIKSFAVRNRALNAKADSMLKTLLGKWGLHHQELVQPELIFAGQAPCILEIGCGNGSNLVHLAQHYPQYNFIGIEVYIYGVLALLKQIEQCNLTNVRVLNYDAVFAMHNCFIPNSIAGINILFPDPWPKKRHHKRRLLNAHNLALFTKVLERGGFLHMASDSAAYCQEIIRLCELNPTTSACNVVLNGSSLWRPITTKFAAKAQAAERSIWDLTCYKL